MRGLLRPLWRACAVLACAALACGLFPRVGTLLTVSALVVLLAASGVAGCAATAASYDS